MTEEIKEAYKITIYDFEIELQNCGLFEFKKRKELRNLIKVYESKLYGL